MRLWHLRYAQFGTVAVLLVGGGVLAELGRSASRPPMPALSNVPGTEQATQAWRGAKEYVFRPRPDVEPWPLRLPLDWSADPFHDRNWEFHLQAWRMLDPMMATYERWENPRVLADIFGFALDWAHFHYDKRQKTQFSWDDMDVGLRAKKLAWMYGELAAGRIVLSAADQTLFDRLVEDHARRLQDWSAYEFTNHSIFQIDGLEELCAVLRQQAYCAHSSEFAAELVPRLLEHQFTEEGIHKEHSPAYHLFADESLRPLRRKSALGGVKLDLSLLDKAEASEAWMIQPDGRIIPVGDSEARRVELRAFAAAAHMPGPRPMLCSRRLLPVRVCDRPLRSYSAADTTVDVVHDGDGVQ